jgi:hypothetical protein
MNRKNQSTHTLDTMLRQAHNQIEPPDSWQALRERIESGLDHRDTPDTRSLHLSHKLAFWRGVALTLAACLLVCTGALFLSVANRITPAPVPASPVFQPITDTQQQRLGQMFNHITQVFADQSPWMVVDSQGDGTIGVATEPSDANIAQERIILRLVTGLNNGSIQNQCFDIVASSGQQVTLQIPMALGTPIDVSLKAVSMKSGAVSLEINAHDQQSLHVNGLVRVPDQAYASLLEVPLDTHRLSMHATARRIPRL